VKQKNGYLRRHDRKEQIVTQFVLWDWQRNGTSFGVADVANVLQLARSTFLREMLNELVVEGILVRHEYPYRSNRDAGAYKLAEWQWEAIEAKYPKSIVELKRWKHFAKAKDGVFMNGVYMSREEAGLPSQSRLF